MRSPRSSRLSLLVLLGFALLAITSRSLASSRFEVLFEEALAQEVLDGYLRSYYPRVTFWPHPTMNGFYAKGTRRELLSIKRDLLYLDHPNWNAPLPLLLPLRHLSGEEAVEGLKRWVPEADCVVGERSQSGEESVLFRGPASARGAVLVSVGRLDRPTVRLRVSRDDLATCQPGRCALPQERKLFECPLTDCGGILHLLGLKSGDSVFEQVGGELPAPFWVVSRDEETVNIFVEFYGP